MATIAERRRGRRPLVSGTGNYGIPNSPQAIQQPFQQQAPAPQGAIPTDPALEEKKFAIGKLQQDIKLLAMQGYSIDNLKGRLDKLNELTEDAKMHEAYNRQAAEEDAKFKEDYGAVPGTPAWEERWNKAFEADRDWRMKTIPGYRDKSIEEGLPVPDILESKTKPKLTQTELANYKEAQKIYNEARKILMPGAIDKATDQPYTPDQIAQAEQALQESGAMLKELQEREKRVTKRTKREGGIFSKGGEKGTKPLRESPWNKSKKSNKEKTIVRTGINKKTGKRVNLYSDGTMEDAS